MKTRIVSSPDFDFSFLFIIPPAAVHSLVGCVEHI